MYSVFLFFFLSFFYQYSYAAFVPKTIIHTPYALQQLGTIKRGQVIVSYNESSKKSGYGTIENISFLTVAQAYKVTCEDGTYFITRPDQQCMLYDSHQWCKVKRLVTGDRLLCKNNRLVTVVAIEQIKENTQLCQIEVAPHHTFFVTERGILVHNNEVALATGAVVALAAVAPPLIPIITVVKCVGLVGLFGAAVWQLLSKNKKRDIKQNVSPSTGSSSPPPPKKPDDENEFKKRHPHGRYEHAGYHSKQDNGYKSRRPTNGQQALDESMLIEDQSRHRISLNNGEFVVMYETSPGLYHGHIRAWKELTTAMQKTLIKHRITKINGKILK